MLRMMRKKEAAAKSRAARAREEEECQDWLSQAIECEKSRAEEIRRAGPSPGIHQEPTLQEKLQGGAMEDERMTCDEEEQEMMEEQQGGQEDNISTEPDMSVIPDCEDNKMEVEDSQHTSVVEQQTVQLCQGEEQEVFSGQLEQKTPRNPPRSLQPSRAKITPRMALELRRKEERWALMSSCRALDTLTTTTTPRPGPCHDVTLHRVRKTAELFATEDSPIKVPSAHPVNPRRGAVHSVCSIVRPIQLPSVQPSGRALPTTADQLQTGNQLEN